MISIDTALLRELVSASSVANDAIDNAVDALNRVSTHNDWGCKEKYAINEYAITNRNKIKQLQENSRGFLNVITQVSNEFEASEKSILDMFSSVESIISEVISIPPQVINIASKTAKNIFEQIKTKVDLEQIKKGWASTNPSLENYQWATIWKPIQVCTFEDINLE